MSAALLLWLPASAAHAGLIRDAEIEHTLRNYTDPVLNVAGIAPQNVRIFIVQDPRINAFVAGGLNLFLHTGLILSTDNPDMLIGVIAHETGHLEGAHLSRLAAKAEQIQIGTLLATVVGAAVGVAGGGEAGAAIGSAGQNTLMRDLIGDVRTNEQSADQAALRYVDTLGYSADGMLEMFTLLRQQDRSSRNADPYLRTHPLTQERVANVRSYISRQSPEKREVRAHKFDEAHARMKAKLYAFLNPPADTFAKYPESDTSIAAQLARAIAHFRSPDLEKALAEVDALLAARPDDPFLYDLKGQILFENGKVKESIEAYQAAVDGYPSSGLLWTDLGRAQLVDGRVKESIKTLKRATVLDNSHAMSWRQLATAYGKDGQLMESSIALAEEAALLGDYETVRLNAKRVHQAAPAGSPLSLRAEALMKVADDLEDQKKG